MGALFSVVAVVGDEQLVAVHLRVAAQRHQSNLSLRAQENVKNLVCIQLRVLFHDSDDGYLK